VTPTAALRESDPAGGGSSGINVGRGASGGGGGGASGCCRSASSGTQNGRPREPPGPALSRLWVEAAAAAAVAAAAETAAAVVALMLKMAVAEATTGAVQTMRAAVGASQMADDRDGYPGGHRRVGALARAPPRHRWAGKATRNT